MRSVLGPHPLPFPGPVCEVKNRVGLRAELEKQWEGSDQEDRHSVRDAAASVLYTLLNTASYTITLKCHCYIPVAT